MTGRYMASGMLSDISIGVEAEHVAKRAIAIYNEVGNQLWPGTKPAKEASPTGGETTPPFQGPKVGMGWSDENLPEDSGYHK
jgi:hypothetical protein